MTSTTATPADAFFNQLDELLTLIRELEPAPGALDRDRFKKIRGACESLLAKRADAFDVLSEVDREKTERLLAVIVGNVGALAVAAGDPSAGSFFENAERFAKDDEKRAELRAAKKDPDGFRALVQGRHLYSKGKESAGRKVWQNLKKSAKDDAIRTAAIEELNAPRALKPGQKLPPLTRINGIGGGLYGHRNDWPDRSYVTTYCICFLFIPVIPLSAWRVKDEGGGRYLFMAREQLSGFAKIFRLALLAVFVVNITGVAVNGYLNDESRLARIAFDDANALVDSSLAGKGDAEAALAAVDSAFAMHSTWTAPDRALKAAAGVVKLVAAKVPSPFTRAHLDEANKVVLRFNAIADEAKGGAARDTLLSLLDAWGADLKAPEDTDARLALLEHQMGVADAARKPAVEAKLAAVRRDVAAGKAKDRPLEAVGILLGEPRDPASVAEAGKLLAGLADKPSLLEDARGDVEAWLAAAGDAAEGHAQIAAALQSGVDARTEDEAEDVTPAKLAAFQKKRPWDQRAAVMLARDDVSDGKLDGAQKRLLAFGEQGFLVRDARFLLAQIAMGKGDLAAADTILSELLASRLQRFLAARADFDAVASALETSLKAKLTTGALPADVLAQLEGASDDKQQEIVRTWFSAQMQADAQVVAKRDVYFSFSDVVPVSIAAGTAKLRRAQGMSGGERDAMLKDAERAFLAIKNEAEGDVQFHLGLGEVFARLGKTEESRQELDGLVARGNLQLSYAVANVYRNIGSTQRATEVAKEVFEKGSGQLRETAAITLALLSTADDEREQWLSKADQKDPFVRTSRLEIEARKLLRQGKHAECDKKFAEAARTHLAHATPKDVSGYNNGALAHRQRFDCSGDVKALGDAEAALERAYRAAPDDPLVVGNLASLLSSDADVRAMAKRIDVKALRPSDSDASALLGMLLRSSERDAVLADLNADPGERRSIELTSQEEVLAPNRTASYDRRLDNAMRRRDLAAAEQLVQRLKDAHGLDTTDAQAALVKWRAGESDALYLEHLAGSIAHFDELLAKPGLDAHTRAAALALQSFAMYRRATIDGNAKDIAAQRALALEAAKLWPAFSQESAVASSFIDEAAFGIDKERWIKERRMRTAVGALFKLAAAKDPLADRIQASPLWASVLPHAKAGAAADDRPDTDDLRLARMLGDADLIKRAEAVRTDKLTRAGVNAAVVLVPDPETNGDDIALLDAP